MISDFGILNLRTTEPFRSDSRTFFSNLRTFGLKNLRTHEPSNLRTFGLMGCNRISLSDQHVVTHDHTVLRVLSGDIRASLHFTFLLCVSTACFHINMGSWKCEPIFLHLATFKALYKVRYFHISFLRSTGLAL